MNSLQVQRMLNALQYPEPAPVESAPVKAPRAPRKKKAEIIQHVESESESGSDSSSGYDDYAEVDKIQSHFKEEPCEYISPATLATKKTKKEAIQYLEEKSCPKIHRLKKMSAPVAPTPSTAPAKKEKKVKAPEPASPLSPAKAPEVVLAAPIKKAPKAKATPAPVAPSLAPPAAAPKTKRAPTAFALLVGKHRKAGLSFADAAKAAKVEHDASKAKA